jgi:BASS family bile acid:Na+ symporter
MMAVIVAVAIAAGAFLGGSDPDQRASLAAASATRHPGIALMIAKGNYTDPHIVAAVLGFLLISLVVAIPCQAALKRVPGAPVAHA